MWVQAGHASDGVRTRKLPTPYPLLDPLSPPIPLSPSISMCDDKRNDDQDSQARTKKLAAVSACRRQHLGHLRSISRLQRQRAYKSAHP